MDSLAEVVGQNTKRIREDHAWSQKLLSQRLEALGGHWSRAAVGMLESKGVRGDSLSDVAILCAALNVKFPELLVGDGEVKLRDGNSKRLSWIQNALSKGINTQDNSPDFLFNSLTSQWDGPEETQRIAKTFGVKESILQEFVDEAVGPENLGILWFRDHLADINEETPKETARAKRGHATRRMAEMVRAYVADEDVQIPEDARKRLAFWITAAQNPGFQDKSNRRLHDGND